jgi:hypothetical protein
MPFGIPLKSFLKDVFQNFKNFGRRKTSFSAEGIGYWEKTEAFSDKSSGGTGDFFKNPPCGCGKEPHRVLPFILHQTRENFNRYFKEMVFFIKIK